MVLHSKNVRGVGPQSLILRKLEMQEKIKQLFWELGNKLKEKDIAEPFYLGGIPGHPAVYIAENVHAFYRGVWNPTKVIYLKGLTMSSTQDEVHLSGKLVEDNYRWEIYDEINLKNAGLGVSAQDMEKAMDIVDKVESTHVLEPVRIPYDAQELEKIVLQSIPEDILRNLV